ncbi:MAG: hypothetical protein JO322_00320 [Candidatus Eremiobacteraeota bacterium]|nr:hypothetical protein [Candidatus Eremiobacteraeota bacterium]
MILTLAAVVASVDVDHQLKQRFYAAMHAHQYHAALQAGREYVQKHPSDAKFELDVAYAAIAAGETQESIAMLRELSTSSNAMVASSSQKQLLAMTETSSAAPPPVSPKQQFYDEMKQHRYDAAVSEANTYLAQHPNDDAFRLDAAYAALGAGDQKAARTDLEYLSKSSDPQISAEATKQLALMTSAAAAPGYLYFSVHNEARFADTFNSLNVRYDLGHSAIRPFASLDASYDTRSGAPGISPVYNDNAAVIALGLRAPFGRLQYGYFYASGGESIGLRGEPSFGDVRYGAAYSRDFGSMDRPEPHTQFYGDVSVYSRYQGDAIGYFQASHDVPIGGHVRVIGGINWALDSQRVYYNNFAEAYAGLAVPFGTTTSLRIEGVAGDYLPRGIDVQRPFYSTLRILLVSGQSIR